MERQKTRISVPIRLAREIRLMKGLSQQEAAERYDVSAALVSSIENGMRPGDVFADYIMRISEAPNKTHRTPGGEQRVGRRVK
jgi:transcriptional regulator with XRE-family HTH domain